MPVDRMSCDRVFVDLRPRSLWAAASVPLVVEHFRLFLHRAAEEEWDEDSRMRAYSRWRRSHADWVTSLIEPPPKWTPNLWQWGLDFILSHVDIDVTHVHLRVEDRINSMAFGVRIRRWHFTNAAVRVVRVLCRSFVRSTHSPIHSRAAHVPLFATPRRNTCAYSPQKTHWGRRGGPST